VLAAAAVTIVFLGIEHLWQTNREQCCRRELEFFSQALIHYHTQAGYLPSAYVMDASGRRMHSWRPRLISFVDVNEYVGAGFHYNFGEPWDSRYNTWFRNKTSFHAYYSCPIYAEGSRNASYLCVVGGVLWPVPTLRDEPWSEAGSCSVGKGGVLPSRGEAILLVELCESHIPWTKPEDITLSEIALLLRKDPSGALFRRQIRNVVTVDAEESLHILDPIRQLREIRAIIDAEYGARMMKAGTK
jgi:hypothetical protein